MNQNESVFKRRKFLKYTLLSVGGLIGASAVGTAVFLSNKYDKIYGKLLLFDGHLTDILHAFCEVAMPEPKNGFPTHQEAEVVKRMDEEFYFANEHIQSDFKAVLYLLEAMPIANGYFSRFSRLSPEKRLAFLNKMQNTENDLYRVAIANIRVTTRMMYYGHPSTWKAIAYDGPFGGLPEVESEQRKYYKNLTTE